MRETDLEVVGVEVRFAHGLARFPLELVTVLRDEGSERGGAGGDDAQVEFRRRELPAVAPAMNEPRVSRHAAKYERQVVGTEVRAAISIGPAPSRGAGQIRQRGERGQQQETAPLTAPAATHHGAGARHGERGDIDAQHPVRTYHLPRSDLVEEPARRVQFHDELRRRPAA